MTGWLEAAGCTLTLVHITISRPDGRWTEKIHLTLTGTCQQATLTLTPDQRLELLGGTITPAHGRSHPALPERLSDGGVLADGGQRVILHLEDLVEGGVADLHLKRRTWTPDAVIVAWPGPQTSFWEVRPPKPYTVTATGLAQDDGRWWWARDPQEGASLRVGAAPPEAAITSPPPPATPLTADEAWGRLSKLAWLDRMFDGELSLTGEAVITRGAVDDRGFARTLVALTQGGAAPAVLARWSPALDVPPAADAPEVALAEGGRPLLHPGHSLPPGALHADGAAIAWPGAEGAPQALPAVTWSARALPGRGDPRASLMQDKGRIEVQATLTRSGEGPLAATFVLPAAAERVEVHEVGPDGEALPASLRRAHRRLWVVGRPTASRVELRWQEPLADTWGPLPAPPELLGSTSPILPTPPDGDVAIDGDGSWRLARLPGVDGAPVELLTSRARLLQELQQRRRVASYPEPAVPAPLRRAPRTWELVEAARAALPERMAIAALDVPPDQLRPLLRARRSGLATEHEAALVLRGWLDQLDIVSEVELLCPTEPKITPVHCAHAVLRVTLDGETRVLDPACPSCAAGTQRPELQGTITLQP